MNISGPFIRRPIGTSLLALGLLLAGIVAYGFLPVASLPSIDLPTIRVGANLPGADPEIMAATVAAPLERRIGEISGITELSSRNTLGGTSIVAQFDLERDPDDAARDVQAAINAARVDLPSSFSRNPTVRKSNPNSIPILILALTSTTLAQSEVYDAADLVAATKISQVPGVAEVTVGGSAQPAIRVQVDPMALSAKGLAMDDVRRAIASANALAPLGRFDATAGSVTLSTNTQLHEPDNYAGIVLKVSNGDIVRLGDVATVSEGSRNRLNAGWFNGEPAVLLIVQKTEDANVVATVEQIKALLPEIQSLIPAGITVAISSDRTTTIQRSVEDLQLTLGAAAILVMLVVLVFLRRPVPMLAAGVTVPLSLAGTVALMWLFGYSLDNLSLLALTISVGFVVDDAIVMIETISRQMERGLSGIEAALAGSRQIGFTVVSISLSLIAAFIPILFMGGVSGRFLREFGMTLSFAIVISAVVSLTVTPMICGQLMRSGSGRPPNLLDRLVEPAIAGITALYATSLRWVLRHSWLMLLVTILVCVLTVHLYMSAPKGFVPRGDTGIINGSLSTAADSSFETVAALQKRVTDIVAADPAVESIGSFVGAQGAWTTSNSGRFFVTLKPLEVRGLSSFAVIERLREKLRAVPGAQIGLYVAQEIALGGRSTQSQYQFTLFSPDLRLLDDWVPRILETLRGLPQLADVGSDRDDGGVQARLVVDREKAATLGIAMEAVDDALNNAFGQRQISTIYTDRNQYRVILEVEPRFQRDLASLQQLYLPGRDGLQVPLSTVTHLETVSAPLVINHEGQFPSVTISYNLADGAVLSAASQAIADAVDRMHLPDGIKTRFAGDAGTARQASQTEPLLILAALLSVYLVLGILYESLIHPLTIISTLPSAGLGALLALLATGTDLSLLTLIGILLLIGIVKKNGIMLVDFALEAERRHGAPPAQAIYDACLERFRPITMTTLAALLGALPLLFATGPGSELRQPLGITIAGGLIVSQFLTIYTTPVIYLTLDRLRAEHRRRRAGVGVPSAAGTS